MGPAIHDQSERIAVNDYSKPAHLDQREQMILVSRFYKRNPRVRDAIAASARAQWAIAANLWRQAAAASNSESVRLLAMHRIAECDRISKKPRLPAA